MTNTTDNNNSYFNTSGSSLLQQIEHRLLPHHDAIESWIDQQLQITPPPLYCSVDLRNAGFKLAPVDTNLFPAGFNNLKEDSLPLCIKAVQSVMEQISPGVRRILIIPEEHTRNVHYYENLAVIQTIFSLAGYEARIGTLLSDLTEPKMIELPSGNTLLLEPLIRAGRRVQVADFSACLILLNNDLSAGLPEILQDLEQTLLPPSETGWYKRLKSNHFQHYQAVTSEFGQKFDIDPWLLSPLFRRCDQVNFMDKDSDQCLLTGTEAVFKEVRQKYYQYDIKQPPFLVVKADSGTYGMGILMIKDPQDLQGLNRKERTKMATIKGGRGVSQVIIQEGVYTIETAGDLPAVAEPVIYMIGKQVVGGFYRIHAQKEIDENLNAPGMSFEPLTFNQAGDQFYSYKVVARLALIAAAREISEA